MPPASNDEIAHAAAALRAGGLVIFPTETVYGLGADATNDTAVAEIFAAKQRPAFNPLIVHFADIVALADHVIWTDPAAKLAAEFWPGPLSLVLRRSPETALSRLVSAGLDTVAVRVPRHDAARKLLAAAGTAIAAPSANRSGSISPTTAAHAVQSLGTAAAASVVDGGACEVGLESTVIDVSGNTPLLLRPGTVTHLQIEAVIGPLAAPAANDAIRSPGMTLRHYAPATPLRLDASDAEAGEILLAFGSDATNSPYNLSPGADLTEAAANLFAMLHAIDALGAGRIAVMPIPGDGLGAAINDRLRRAADAE